MSVRTSMSITGGGRGIGAARVRIAAGSGYDVAFTYRQAEKEAKGLADEISPSGARALAIQADVAVEADVLRAFSESTTISAAPCAG